MFYFAPQCKKLGLLSSVNIYRRTLSLQIRDKRHCMEDHQHVHQPLFLGQTAIHPNTGPTRTSPASTKHRDPIAPDRSIYTLNLARQVFRRKKEEKPDYHYDLETE